VSRRVSVVTCFYRTCVIDAVLDASPAAYVRRPPVPSGSPTLGLSHLQFEAMTVAARTSTNAFDFALVAMLGLLGLRVFEACSSTIEDLGEEHGHRVLRVLGKGTKLALIPLPRRAGLSTAPSATECVVRSCSTATMSGWTATPPPGDSNASPPRPGCGCRGCTHTFSGHTYVTTMPDAGVSLRDMQIAARHADPETTMRYDRVRKNLDRHPNYILAAYMASGT
jgi:integrase/recombinase XerD